MNPLSIDRRWIYVTVGLLAANVLVMAVLVVASTRHPAAVIPSYYERAVAWDERVAEQKVADELGWAIEVKLARDGIAVSARDGAGRPLAGAHVTGSAFHRSAPERRTELSLETDADGWARTTPAQWRATAGMYEVELLIKRGAVSYSLHREVELRDETQAGAKP